MTKIGYARVASLSGNNLEQQIATLRDAGCETVFAEQLSGMVTKRPQFDAALRGLGPDDELVVISFDRLSRDIDIVRSSFAAIAACGATATALDGSIDEFQSLSRS